jgi:hypothetical protein|eukprot:1255207-Prymnesium_polylepis.1
MSGRTAAHTYLALWSTAQQSFRLARVDAVSVRFEELGTLSVGVKHLSRARARICDQLSLLVTGRVTHKEVGCVVTLYEKRDYVDGSHVMDVCMVFR